MTRNTPRYVLGLAVAGLAATVLSLCVGAAPIALGRVLDVVAGGGESWERTVLLEIRLPRAVVAALVGAALAGSGAALQALFKNPLADPGVLGVTSGASLAAVAAIASGLAHASASVLPAAAAAGAALSSLVLIGTARDASERTVSLLVLGVALSSALSAVTALVVALSLEEYLVAQQIVYWLMGGLEARTWHHALGGIVPIAVGTSWIARRAPVLDALALGETEAGALGVDVPRARLEIVVASALAVGTSVAIAGSIGFVGLLVPHLVRSLVGGAHARLVPLAAATGAVLLVLADLVARAALAPREIPVGVVTALIGAPTLFFVARHRSRA